jgi:hypothetical protein
VSKLGKAVAHYLALRRTLGFKLGRTETRLRQFLAFMESKGTTRITTALALEGEQPDRLLPILATYLGHAHVSGTYWYLSSTPELMQAAGQRLERRWKGIR